ncbi:hypothetical protein NM680_13055 [Paracoccus sp. PS-1]|uniref:hypothetical protein n=1 Tax=Paracoccus sp. PS1 TaxID=2963938 RepID=UPI0027E3E9B9|nr:hypothetical protein [Paracoccus sp. PS1]MDQ7262721.1 hypothetical protein [Paracoccus sp. PS1]
MSDDLTRCPCCEGEGYFYGDEKPPSPWGDAAELSRLRAEVERLKWERDLWREKMDHALQCERDSRAALAEERRHADAMADALERATVYAEGPMADRVEPMVRQCRAALAQHRARRQG